MNLRRSSRIAQMYDDNFSYCEKDDRSLSNFRPSTPLRRSSRIAELYDDNFSYCETDDRDIQETYFTPDNAAEFLNTIENEVVEFLTNMAHQRRTTSSKRPTRHSERIAVLPYVDYEALNRGVSMEEQQKMDEEYRKNLRRSSRIQNMAPVYYYE